MNKPILTSALLILLCLHSPAEAAIPTHRSTIPSDFYQVIIDNNLFRPLGWRKPRSISAFELIATVMRQNGAHKALLRSAETYTLHYAASVTIAEIARHAVTLNENGTSKAYRLPL